jgi:hypothetical protein
MESHGRPLINGSWMRHSRKYLPGGNMFSVFQNGVFQTRPALKPNFVEMSPPGGSSIQ